MNNNYYQKEISEWENEELIQFLYTKNYNILLELCKKYNLNGYDLFFINDKILKEDFNIFNFHERNSILKLIKYIIHNQLKITFTSNKTGEKISIILTKNSQAQLKDFTLIISNIFKLNPNTLIFRDFKGKEILSPTNNILDLIIEFPFKYKEINVVNCNDLNEINNNYYNLNEINNNNNDFNYENEFYNNINNINKEEKKVIKHNYSFDNNLERKKNTVNLLSKKINNLDTKINEFKKDNNNNNYYNNDYFPIKYKTRNNSNNSKIINTNSNLTNFTNNNNNESNNFKQMSLTPKVNKFFHFKNKNYNNNINQFNNIYNTNNKILENNDNNYYTNENINYNNINNNIYKEYNKNNIIKSERVLKHERKKFNKLINNNNYLINDLNNSYNYQTKIINNNNNNNEYLNNENINYNNNFE